MQTILSINNLDLKISDRGINTPILRDINLEINEGEVHGLVGESGGGKTMVGKSILGIIPKTANITKGSILFDGKIIEGSNALPRKGLLGSEISMILQDPMTALNPVLKIKTQMIDVLRKHKGFSKASALVRATELLESVHMRDPERILEQYPFELSGGMRQRVIIAIAFACDPKLVIADEPTTALDVTVQKQILRLIKEQQIRTKAAVLFITHDLGVVAKICNRVSIIHSGMIIENQSIDGIFKRPKSKYLKALLNATPRYDKPAELLVPVEDNVIDDLINKARFYDEGRDSA
ncbi:MAG: ABC transporter ATP-binding protein [Pseudomonadota bacterium]|nr:ABC transporter ATP-binding protein [Pseudomonadota bacterium]